MQNICPKDFFKKNSYNFETKNQLWCSQIADAHDNFCGCDHPFAHLLSSIFPPGHTDRNLTINQILTRDYTERCLSGGTEEESPGGADGNTGAAEDLIPKREDAEEDFPGQEIEDLLAAATKENER